MAVEASGRLAVAHGFGGERISIEHGKRLRAAERNQRRARCMQQTALRRKDRERLRALGRIVKTGRTRLDQACTILPRMLVSTGGIVQ